MHVELSHEERELVERAIASGRLRRPEDAVHEAMGLWMERERRRDEILGAIDEAEQSLANGDGIPIDENSMRMLARDVKSRGRTRARTIASQ